MRGKIVRELRRLKPWTVITWNPFRSVVHPPRPPADRTGRRRRRLPAGARPAGLPGAHRRGAEGAPRNGAAAGRRQPGPLDRYPRRGVQDEDHWRCKKHKSQIGAAPIRELTKRLRGAHGGVRQGEGLRDGGGLPPDVLDITVESLSTTLVWIGLVLTGAGRGAVLGAPGRPASRHATHGHGHRHRPRHRDDRARRHQRLGGVVGLAATATTWAALAVLLVALGHALGRRRPRAVVEHVRVHDRLRDRHPRLLRRLRAHLREAAPARARRGRSARLRCRSSSRCWRSASPSSRPTCIRWCRRCRTRTCWRSTSRR